MERKGSSEFGGGSKGAKFTQMGTRWQRFRAALWCHPVTMNPQSGPTAMYTNVLLAALVGSKKGRRRCCFLTRHEYTHRSDSMHPDLTVVELRRQPRCQKNVRWLLAKKPKKNWHQQPCQNVPSPIWQTLASYLQEANFSRCSSVVLTLHWSLAHLYFRGPKPGEGGRFEGRIPKASYFRANHSRVTWNVTGTRRRATENFW